MYNSKSFYQLEDYDDDLSEIIRSTRTIANPIKGDRDQDQTTKTSSKPFVSSVNRNDLHKIRLIGSGQYCNVYSVTGILRQSWQLENQDKQFPARRSELALKSIDTSRLSTIDDLIVAATDLANEAKILSQLDHKNIIRLRGISEERFSQSYLSGGESTGGFFIVLDVLKETLGHRLRHWRENNKGGKYANNVSRSFPKPSSLRRGLISKARSKLSHLTNVDDCHRYMMYNRIENIAFGIAEGMEYLHSKQIVLRDLKPTNIGFDFETGTQIQLFDFGMARRVTECASDEICGSPKYMAPEAMSGKGYSLKVDTYSFGIVLFEICSLRNPYADNYWNEKKQLYNHKNSRWSKLKNFGTKNESNQTKNMNDMLEDFYSHVVEKQLRPSDDLDSTIPCSKIRSLIRDCWSKDPDDRPTFTEILSRLEIIFNRQRLPQK